MSRNIAGRLTTLLVLLTLIRDLAREKGATKLADRIDDLVTNRHEDGPDHYKLLPSRARMPLRATAKPSFVSSAAPRHPRRAAPYSRSFATGPRSRPSCCGPSDDVP
jgi:hypothetical protein